MESDRPPTQTVSLEPGEQGVCIESLATAATGVAIARDGAIPDVRDLGLGPCGPAAPAKPALAARKRAAPTPVQLATEFWYRVQLPVPRPVSLPDYATTGKTTYLQAGDTDSPPAWTRATPLGTLTIVAHGIYTVEWGDGVTTGPYSTPGGPYPDGTITHTYDTVGTVRITVLEAWTATWTIGAVHGTLGGLRTTGAIPDFPVRQIQAVITG